MRLFQAPMEGVIDHHLRAQLSAIGGLDVCVTEFLRITNSRLPDRAFLRICPELEQSCSTASGTPVHLQLLGSDPQWLAANAQKAEAMGACAIDLNFGCPAKTVNNHRGGAVLLDEPDTVHSLVSAVANAVKVPVTAKMRLGFRDRERMLDNARAIEAGGARDLAVHARTRSDGYTPPAWWDQLALIVDAVAMPVIANGEIWTVEDWRRCRAESGCEDFMLGRGLLARPDLALQIRAAAAGEEPRPLQWSALCKEVREHYRRDSNTCPPRYHGNRLKQWLAYLKLAWPQAGQLFESIKKSRDPQVIEAAFDSHLYEWQTMEK